MKTITPEVGLVIAPVYLILILRLCGYVIPSFVDEVAIAILGFLLCWKGSGNSTFYPLWLKHFIAVGICVTLLRFFVSHVTFFIMLPGVGSILFEKGTTALLLTDLTMLFARTLFAILFGSWLGFKFANRHRL